MKASAIIGFCAGAFSGDFTIVAGTEYLETPSGYWTRADGEGPLLTWKPQRGDWPPLVARVVIEDTGRRW